MTRASIELRDKIFGKSYGFLSFAKNIGKVLIKSYAVTKVKTSCSS